MSADIKIRTAKKVTTTGFLPAMPYKPEETLYVHDMSQREEFIGYVDAFQGPSGREPHMAIVTHCDTGIVYQIDLDRQEYRETKLLKYPSQQQFEKQVAQAKKDAEKKAHANTVDTGESKAFYGHPAKHLVTTITRKTDLSVSENTVDGWYLDLPQPGCAPEYMRWNRGHEAQPDGIAVLVPNTTRYPIQVVRVGPNGNPGFPSATESDFIYTGFLPSGFAIQQNSRDHRTLKMSTGGNESFEVVTEQEVIEFSEGPLDPALFEVPAGFKKVNKLYQHEKAQGH